MSTVKSKKVLIEPVPFYSIHHDTELNFDLYAMDQAEAEKKKYKKVKGKGDIYCLMTKEALIQKKTESLFIKSEEKDVYMSYIEKYLNKISNDTTIPLKERSKMIYSVASNVLENLFTVPESPANIKKVKGLVEDTISVVFSDATSIKTLIEVSSYDYYTYTHSVDVAVYAIGFGKHLDLSHDKLKKLGYSAMLHDIGKSKIDSAIINKNGRLTPEEFEKIKQHPTFGHTVMLSHNENDPDILDGIKYHHEKYDGSGYPSALKGDQIPFFAQIISICDIFGALSTRRSYKDAHTSFEALSLMKNQMTSHFDIGLLAEFIRFMGQQNSAV